MPRNLKGADEIRRKNAFIRKLYAMLQDPKLASMIWWSQSINSSQPMKSSSNTFTLRPNKEFSECLKLYFKHGNVASLVRQLHMYGFHKVMGDKLTQTDSEHPPAIYQETWSFTHSGGLFRQGDESSLHRIKRRPGLNSTRRQAQSSFVGLELQHIPVLQSLLTPMPSFSNGAGGPPIGGYSRQQQTSNSYLIQYPTTYAQQSRMFSLPPPYYPIVPSSYHAPQDPYPSSFTSNTVHPYQWSAQPRVNPILTVGSLTLHFHSQVSNSGQYSMFRPASHTAAHVQRASDLISVQTLTLIREKMGHHGQFGNAYASHTSGPLQQCPMPTMHTCLDSQNSACLAFESLSLILLSSAPSGGSSKLIVGARFSSNKDYTKMSTPLASASQRLYEGSQLPRMLAVSTRKTDMPLDGGYLQLALSRKPQESVIPQLHQGEKIGVDADTARSSSEHYSPKRVSVPSLLA